MIGTKNTGKAIEEFKATGYVVMKFKDASTTLDALRANIEWVEGNKLENIDDIYWGELKRIILTPINVVSHFQFVSFSPFDICSKSIKSFGGILECHNSRASGLK